MDSRLRRNDSLGGFRLRRNDSLGGFRLRRHDNLVNIVKA